MEKAEFMVTVRVWPLRNELDPHRWLSNFKEQERKVAVHLLDQFMYFGEELLDAASFLASSASACQCWTLRIQLDSVCFGRSFSPQ